MNWYLPNESVISINYGWKIYYLHITWERLWEGSALSMSGGYCFQINHICVNGKKKKIWKRQVGRTGLKESVVVRKEEEYPADGIHCLAYRLRVPVRIESQRGQAIRSRFMIKPERDCRLRLIPSQKTFQRDRTLWEYVALTNCVLFVMMTQSEIYIINLGIKCYSDIINFRVVRMCQSIKCQLDLWVCVTYVIFITQFDFFPISKEDA